MKSDCQISAIEGRFNGSVWSSEDIRVFAAGEIATSSGKV
jgi:hypothetical protein